MDVKFVIPIVEGRRERALAGGIRLVLPHVEGCECGFGIDVHAENMVFLGIVIPIYEGMNPSQPENH